MTDAFNVLPQYENYKPSGVDWLDGIPDTWSTERSKWIFQERKGRARRGDRQLTALQKYGMIYQDEFMALEGRRVTQVVLNNEILKRVECGDFVMSMRTFQGGLEYSPYEGSCSSAYIALMPVSEQVSRRYFKWLFKSGRYIEALSSTSNLVRDGQALRFENFSKVDLPVVPINEQDAIADFLDVKTAQIDQAIEIKEKQIALLQERKQILIQNAVTRGLNPDVPMKDSGVDWIGHIPAHWNVNPLFTEATIKSISNCPEREILSVYLDMGVVRFADVDQKRTNATSLDLSGYQAVDPGDFVLNNQQAWRGSVGVSSHSGIVSSAYIVLSLSDRYDTAFANLLFRSSVMVAHYLKASRGVGTIQRNLYWPYLKGMPVFIPPKTEQAEIVAHVQRGCSQIDETLASLRGQIDRLFEYKSSLINSAVTGKIRVV